MWLPWSPIKFPKPPEPYEEWMARKNREKAMEQRERFLPMEESEMYRWAMGARPMATAEQLAEAQKQIKQLQDLLRHEKERSTMFRKQRDDLQSRLDEIGDIAGR